MKEIPSLGVDPVFQTRLIGGIEICFAYFRDDLVESLGRLEDV